MIKTPKIQPFPTKDALRAWLDKLFLSEHFILYISLLFFLILWPIVPRIASGQNIANLASNMWPLLALAVGQMFVLIVGGIDLSQTSIMAFVSVSGAILMTSEYDPMLFENNPLWGTFMSPEGGLLAGHPLATPIGVLIMLLLGVCVGAINGVSVAKFKMPPFMVTLVSMMFFSGVAIFLTQSENIIHLPESFVTIGKGKLAFLSIPFLIALFIAGTAHYIMTKTVLGRWFYATGKNIKTSIVSGVPTGRVIITAYMFSGFCAAVASILYSARLEGGRPTLGQTQMLDIVGAAVIGGISLMGGKGKVLWAIYGVIFFTLLANALNMLNLSYFTINIVKGLVILAAAFLDVTRSRLSKQASAPPGGCNE